VPELTAAPPPALRRAIRAVALMNLGYFGVEFAAALAIGSVALFADSIDFLEDAALNLLILAALGWPPVWRARVGLALAAILLVPTAATLWTAWARFTAPVAPDPAILSLTGVGALAVNLAAAVLLVRHRHRGGSLSVAAFLSARNDAAANAAIILAGLLTAATGSHWPDLAVGLGIAALNLDAAWKVAAAARREGSGAAA
jgi:Co/Zn/Cd efflux system component